METESCNQKTLFIEGVNEKIEYTASSPLHEKLEYFYYYFNLSPRLILNTESLFTITAAIWTRDSWARDLNGDLWNFSQKYGMM
jgi:hypothetical protein